MARVISLPVLFGGYSTMIGNLLGLGDDSKCDKKVRPQQRNLVGTTKSPDRTVGLLPAVVGGI